MMHEMSPYLRSVCCDAPIAMNTTEWSFRDLCTLIVCMACKNPIDYFDDDAKWIIDKMSVEEFALTPFRAQSFYMDGLRKWTDDLYAFQLYSRMQHSRRVIPFTQLNLT